MSLVNRRRSYYPAHTPYELTAVDRALARLILQWGERTSDPVAARLAKRYA